MTTCPFEQSNDYKINWEATTFGATTFGEPKRSVEPEAPAATDDDLDDLVVVRYEA
jgi:hypothetical protein